MSQIENTDTSSSKTKRSYRKGDPLSTNERKSVSLARKRKTHKAINVYVLNPLKVKLEEFCKTEGVSQSEMIAILIEQEGARRNKM